MAAEQNDVPAGVLPGDSEATEKVIADRYMIVREIGRGGMGIVYVAMDERLKRYVAIKRLVPRSTNTRVIQRRFLREARTVASLVHYNIVSIYDINQDDRGYYITMEYVGGPRLDGEAERTDPPAPLALDGFVRQLGPLSVPDAKAYMVKLCNAMQYAHDHGIIHRDVKPANVLLDSDREPKLVDFGLARPIEKGQNDEITMDGALLGTPEYSAPEQWGDAKGVDHRADLYALGGLFWFMLSGKIPRYYREADVPPEVSAIINKALSNKPEDRFQTASEMAKAVESGMAMPPPQGGPQPQPQPGAQPGQTPPNMATMAGTPVSVISDGSISLNSIGHWTCQSCGKPNPDSAAYCVHCGAYGVRQCPVCNAEFKSDSNFCPVCGVNVDKAEESADVMQGSVNLANQKEYATAIELLKDMLDAKNSEAQKLAKDWREIVLKRRNLLVDFETAMRVFNFEKAAQAACELQDMVPGECLSESADFEVVVKHSQLISELRQQLWDAAHRAQEERNLQKFEESVTYLNQVFGKETIAGLNEQLENTKASLDHVLSHAGLAIGMNCFSRAMEVINSVAPWRGGELGERRARVCVTCKEALDERERKIDEVEAVMREGRFSDALRLIRSMGKFRLPPTHSEMQPAEADLEANERIMRIDKELMRTIDHSSTQWLQNDNWAMIINAITVLKEGDSRGWLQLVDRLKAAANKEIARRYNKAVELERKMQLFKAEKAWIEFLRIPRDLVSGNLYKHASEFPARKQAHVRAKLKKGLKHLVLIMLAAWFGYGLMVLMSLSVDKVAEPGSGVGTYLKYFLPVGLQLVTFVVVLFLLSRRKWRDLFSPDLPFQDLRASRAMAFMAAVSPLSYGVFTTANGIVGMIPATSDATRALTPFMAVAVIWFIADILRSSSVRLPSTVALSLTWGIVAAGISGNYNEVDRLMVVWPLAALGHGVMFVIVALLCGTSGNSGFTAVAKQAAKNAKANPRSQTKTAKNQDAGAAQPEGVAAGESGNAQANTA